MANSKTLALVIISRMKCSQDEMEKHQQLILSSVILVYENLKNVNKLPSFVFAQLQRDTHRIWPSELAFPCKFYTNDFLLFEQLVTFSGSKVIYLQRKKPNLIKLLI